MDLEAFGSFKLKKSTVELNYPEPLIHHLPVELPQRIFLLIVHNVPDSDYPSIFSLQYHDRAAPGLWCGYIFSVNFSTPPLLLTRGSGHISRLTFPGDEPLNPFLPSLLQSWPSRSGDQPLTLRLVTRLSVDAAVRFKLGPGGIPDSEPNPQILEVLLYERGRWETNPDDDSPISPHIDIRHKCIAIFKALQLPMLQKLILAGELGKAQAVLAGEALAASSCRPRVVDFQTTTSPSKADAGIAFSCRRGYMLSPDLTRPGQKRHSNSTDYWGEYD
ncbi:hypothetical protein K503DRAFT_785109 [Rhizopogon vinicolor AM-OR11-026]|uniref:Uncharacterized protein n=1 Tax=Rhizopogon vinicolor AM-OR11-026 TaxID=1314800 RepID=A0A1B7MS62_9AGAM|nr:hypothetical protein K503DRAFT_785109 [Rhizopogon vinicolor AM-OR11-026]